VGAVLLAVCIFGVIKIVDHFTETKLLSSGTQVSITIDEGESAKSIGATLQKAGLVTSVDAFTSFVTKQDVANALKPGTYEMTGGMSLEDIVNLLVEGPTYGGVELIIPEGQTVEQTAARVESTCSIPAADFISLAYSASSYADDYPFLSKVYNNSMEGYLFPKTYDVPPGTTADGIIRMMLDQFKTETASLDLSYAASKNLDQFDVVTIASCIEKEAYFDDDRTLISSVIYNRLSQRIKLGLDVTVSYAVGKAGTGQELTVDDLQTESPYNTRLNYGLPAGPICSPGLASLKAAASPAQTEYLYFILTSEKSEFYVTYEDFQAGKAAWQSSQS
jgi:UPF0755 protein